MKRLNNQGFAISTVLYGLVVMLFLIVLLLISIMSQNRTNTKQLVQTIEDELNRYSETTTSFAYRSGDTQGQAYRVPSGQAGWYKIELWGASVSKKGDYTSGITYLEEGRTIYFFIGGTSSSISSTEVRLTNGTREDATSKNSQIMVAAGNGGSSKIYGYGNGDDWSGSGLKYMINGNILTQVNSGVGNAKIELVYKSSSSTTPPRTHTKLQNVRYIKDCISGNTNNYWLEIQAIQAGNNVARGKMTTPLTELTDGSISNGKKITKTGVNQCVIVDLKTTYNLDEIAIYHQANSKYRAHTVQVSSNQTTWISLKGKNIVGNASYPYGVLDEKEGIHFSAWQLVDDITIPNGDYYIFSDARKNQVLSASNTNVSFTTFTGSDKEKWRIERNTDGSYKILNKQNGYALQVQDGISEIGEIVDLSTSYHGYTWEKWSIERQDMGNFYIKIFNSIYPLGSDSVSNSNVKLQDDTKENETNYLKLLKVAI